MNESTKLFLDSLDFLEYPKFHITFVEKVNEIYHDFKEYDKNSLTLDVVENIFNRIEKICYKNKFYEYLKTYPKKKSKINFNNYGNRLCDVGAFMETVIYNKYNVEYDKYDFGFNIELDALNSIKSPKIFYSGGYITRSRVIFIILMLVHESLHILEYKDSFLCRGGSYHSIFFYKYAYLLFGILSRLSEVFSEKQRNLLVFDTKERQEQLCFNIPLNIQKNRCGESILNDHSHYCENRKEKLLGYITYEDFIDNNNLVFIEDIGV